MMMNSRQPAKRAKIFLVIVSAVMVVLVVHSSKQAPLEHHVQGSHLLAAAIGQARLLNDNIAHQHQEDSSDSLVVREIEHEMESVQMPEVSLALKGVQHGEELKIRVTTLTEPPTLRQGEEAADNGDDGIMNDRRKYWSMAILLAVGCTAFVGTVIMFCGSKMRCNTRYEPLGEAGIARRQLYRPQVLAMALFSGHVIVSCATCLNAAMTGELSAASGLSWEYYFLITVLGSAWLLAQAVHRLWIRRPGETFGVTAFAVGAFTYLMPFVSDAFDTLKDSALVALLAVDDAIFFRCLGGLAATWLVGVHVYLLHDNPDEAADAILSTYASITYAAADNPHAAYEGTILQRLQEETMVALYKQTLPHKLKLLILEDSFQGAATSLYVMHKGNVNEAIFVIVTNIILPFVKVIGGYFLQQIIRGRILQWFHRQVRIAHQNGNTARARSLLLQANSILYNMPTEYRTTFLELMPQYLADLQLRNCGVKDLEASTLAKAMLEQLRSDEELCSSLHFEDNPDIGVQGLDDIMQVGMEAQRLGKENLAQGIFDQIKAQSKPFIGKDFMRFHGLWIPDDELDLSDKDLDDDDIDTLVAKIDPARHKLKLDGNNRIGKRGMAALMKVGLQAKSSGNEPWASGLLTKIKEFSRQFKGKDLAPFVDLWHGDNDFHVSVDASGNLALGTEPITSGIATVSNPEQLGRIAKVIVDGVKTGKISLTQGLLDQLAQVPAGFVNRSEECDIAQAIVVGLHVSLNKPIPDNVAGILIRNTELRFNGGYLDEDAVHFIAKALQLADNKVTLLQLNVHPFTANGMRFICQALEAALRDPHCQVGELCLHSERGMDDDCVVRLSKALPNSKVHFFWLTGLSRSGNDVSDAGGRALAQALQASRGLRQMSLGGFHFTDATLAAFTEAIAKSKRRAPRDLILGLEMAGFSEAAKSRLKEAGEEKLTSVTFR